MASQSNVKNNKEIICAEVAGGIYTSQQLQLISELAAEDIIVKATENQRLALVVSARNRAQLLKDSKKSQFLQDIIVRVYINQSVILVI